MTEASTNTSNMSSPSYISTPSVGEVKPQVAEAPKTVDMTAVESPAVAAATTETTTPEKTTKFDSDTTTLATSYIQNYMSGYGKQQAFRENENGDGFSFTVAAGSRDALVNAFKGQIMSDEKNKSIYTNAKQQIASMDNTNFRYMTHPTLGVMRVPINAEGKDIGIPELV